MAMGFKPPRLFGGLMPTQQEEEDPYGAMMGRVGAPTMPTGQPPAQEQADRPASFWNGGSKFGVRDGIAGALAVIGDAFAQQGGGQGGSVSMLTEGRAAQLAQAKAAERQAQVLADLQANGMTAEQARLIASGTGKVGDFQTKPNDTERDYDFIAKQISPEAANEWLKRKGDPDVAMSLPGNRFYAGPRSGLGGALGGSSAPAAAKPALQPGHTEDGYQFQGGDPADPKNWKPAGGGSGNAAGGFPGTSLFLNRRGLP